jgi:hypothetical protein
MKFLDPRTHGYVDYLAVALLALAPALFGFTGTPAVLCYVLAVVQLGMSLVTAYPLSIVKLLPFTIHGGIELATSVFLVVAPWLLGFADMADARNFFIVSGVGLLLVYLLTNYKAADQYRVRGPRHERVPSRG